MWIGILDLWTAFNTCEFVVGILDLSTLNLWICGWYTGPLDYLKHVNLWFWIWDAESEGAHWTVFCGTGSWRLYQFRDIESSVMTNSGCVSVQIYIESYVTTGSGCVSLSVQIYRKFCDDKQWMCISSDIYRKLCDDRQWMCITISSGI